MTAVQVERTALGRRERLLASDTGRVTVAWSCTFLTLVVVIVALAFRGVALRPLEAALLGYSIYGPVYVVLTLRTFWGADAARLRQLLGGTRVGRRGPLHSALAGGDGAATTVTFAVVALVAVVLVTAGQDGSLSLGVGVLLATTVAASWCMAPVSYAVHYAALHSREGGLLFPGDQEPVFSDYLYVACAVATTLGTTDVTVTSARMRRTVTVQTLLAFAWNTVVVALLIVALTS